MHTNYFCFRNWGCDNYQWEQIEWKHAILRNSLRNIWIKKYSECYHKWKKALTSRLKGTGKPSLSSLLESNRVLNREDAGGSGGGGQRPRLSQWKLMILDSVTRFAQHRTVPNIFKHVSDAICQPWSHWEPYFCQLRLHSWLVWCYSCRLKTPVMKTRSLRRTWGLHKISASLPHFHKHNLCKIWDSSRLSVHQNIFVGHSDQVWTNKLKMSWTRHIWSFFFVTEYIDLDRLFINFLI